MKPRSYHFEAVLRTGRPVVGDLARGPVSQENDFTIRVPVIRGGEVVYVMTAVVEPVSILDVLNRQRIRGDGDGLEFKPARA